MPDNDRNLPQEYARTSGGKFATGNPGRPKGSRNAVSRKAIAEIHNLSDAALDALKANVAAGDHRAVAYVLDRVLPAGRTLEIDMSANGVAEAVAEGSLSIAELKEIAAAIGSLKALSEMDSLREELADLRRVLGGE